MPLNLLVIKKWKLKSLFGNLYQKMEIKILFWKFITIFAFIT